MPPGTLRRKSFNRAPSTWILSSDKSTGAPVDTVSDTNKHDNMMVCFKQNQIYTCYIYVHLYVLYIRTHVNVYHYIYMSTVNVVHHIYCDCTSCTCCMIKRTVIDCFLVLFHFLVVSRLSENAKRVWSFIIETHQDLLHFAKS